MLAAKVDIFCRVIDNYGDIGVSWRLAMALAHEHGCAVRLFVDDLSAARFISADPQQKSQIINHIELNAWPTANDHIIPAQVVIETFACELPEFYRQAMTKLTSPLVWINLEYLSAEGWVESHHGLPSPQTNGKKKYFFFPGFTPSTGGLLREHTLIPRREAFQADPCAQDEFLATLGIPAATADMKRMFLFCYPNAPWKSLLDYIYTHPTQLLVAATVLPTLPMGIHGVSTIHRLPFVSQDQFDHLLWAMDFNFVRGEDSFIRAHWANKPFIWQIYPQSENTHATKLDAWLRLSQAPETLRNIHASWNELPSDDSFSDIFTTKNHLDWQAHYHKWTNILLNQKDLATQLAIFSMDRLK